MVCFSSPKTGFVGAWGSWSKEVESRGAELPEQPPPCPFAAKRPAAILVPVGEKRMSILPKPFHAGILHLRFSLAGEAV